MVNRSKVNDSRFWKKWQESGAVGTLEDAYETVSNRKKLVETAYNVLRMEDVMEDAKGPMTSSELLALKSRSFYTPNLESLPVDGNTVINCNTDSKKVINYITSIPTQLPGYKPCSHAENRKKDLAVAYNTLRVFN